MGGHEGYSGTPLWKIQQQNAAQREAALQESLAYAAERTRPIVPPNVLAEAVSVGGPSGKPFARHVLVKCLRKVAQNSKVELPATGLFANQAPMGLFALFDGQSSAGDPGPAAAEFCARNFHKKVLENLASLPPGCVSETFVKAALVKSFQELDEELLDTRPDIKDGCGAAVALLLGEHLFTAVLGTCDVTLCEAGPRSVAVPLGRAQGRCGLPEERALLARAGGSVLGEGPAARVVGPAGSSRVSRTLGDPAWKRQGAALTCNPEVQASRLSWAERHLFLLLATTPVGEALGAQEMVAAASGFAAQPRAACGEVVSRAMARSPCSAPGQFTVVEVWFLSGGPNGMEARDEEAPEVGREAPKKKAKIVATVALPGREVKSARLRHILVRYQEPGAVPDDRKPSSTRQESEALLRAPLTEFRDELSELKRRFGKLKRPEELALKSERFLRRCKEHSVCPTAQKGGGMCGDLGWVSREAQRKLSREFQEAVAVLRPGDWSDIVPSADGLHIIQRIA